VGSQTTVYVYDAFGNLEAEYSSQTSTSPCGTATCYLTFDHLGSTRMLTDTAGSNGTASSNVLRYDYLPFGGELLASTNGRTTGMGYFPAADFMNPKFTGKNRDGETFLDWFEVRYFSSAQGRFQSPDPANAGVAIGDPQTWNAYSYVANNPLSYTDPSGMFLPARSKCRGVC
jgi:RHS repeat-associated protein